MLTTTIAPKIGSAAGRTFAIASIESVPIVVIAVVNAVVIASIMSTSFPHDVHAEPNYSRYHPRKEREQEAT